jgi:hypothetical protein
MAVKQLIPVDFITRYHRYVGVMETNGWRLSDRLIDPLHDFVEIHDVRVSGLQRRTAEERSAKVILKKQEIVLVIPQGPYEAPAVRITHFIKKEQWHAVIAVCKYLLYGTIHLPLRTQPIALLQETSPLRKFLAVTDVDVHSDLLGVEPVHFEVVLVNRPAIDSLEVTDSAALKPASEPRSEQLVAQTSAQALG